MNQRREPIQFGMPLFGKSKAKQLREQILVRAFGNRERRHGRMVGQGGRQLRLVDGQWVDDGPTVSAELERRFQEWLENAPNDDPDFESDLAEAEEWFRELPDLVDGMYAAGAERAARRR